MDYSVNNLRMITLNFQKAFACRNGHDNKITNKIIVFKSFTNPKNCGLGKTGMSKDHF